MPLLSLPADLLARILARFSPAEIAQAGAVSGFFTESQPPQTAGGAREPSILVQALQLRAEEHGYVLPVLPFRWLCFAAMQHEANPPARLAAGETHSLFIDGEGRLWSWGSEEEDEVLDKRPGLLGHGDGRALQLKVPTRLLGGEHVVSVAAASDFSLALSADGSVWSWGAGLRSVRGSATLGHGDDVSNQRRPKKIEALAGHRIVAVSVGWAGHSLAVSADGTVWSWGGGDGGILGHGDEQDQPLPKKIEALAGQRVVAVSAGGHSLALTADGAAWSWGGGSLLPKKIEALTGRDIVAVSAGDTFSLAVSADGTVWSWGGGDGGILGHGDEQDEPLPKKIEALTGQRIVSISAGGDSGVAVTADGEVWSWGDLNEIGPPTKVKGPKAALLPPRPPSSVYFHFVAARRADLKAAHPDVGVADLARMMGEEWKARASYPPSRRSPRHRREPPPPLQAMSDEDKAPFERAAEQDKQRYRAECLAAGIEVSDVVDAKPALYYYLKSQRIAIAEANPEAGPAELMQMMRQNFAALSEEERAPFEEEAAADKTRHEQEITAEAPPPPLHTLPRPARAPLRGLTLPLAAARRQGGEGGRWSGRFGTAPVRGLRAHCQAGQGGASKRHHSPAAPTVRARTPRSPVRQPTPCPLSLSRPTPLPGSASSPCRLGTSTPSLAPPTAPCGAGAQPRMATVLAAWATEMTPSPTSGCRRRSRCG